MALLPSRPWLRLACLVAAAIVLAALVFGLRIHVVGDPPGTARVLRLAPPPGGEATPRSAAPGVSEAPAAVRG
ncbi:hypothetical protein [Sphingomonas sp. BK235]|jgi:hypothetical protein|uniref:hypothetical protein n=1 Tax=Sphingomonas sp. BK235 TaxID=2512131 RepID=UPI001047BF47|nr:hypothetical protein [Sphingomonas sp. BK235]TCP33797.1 hypothetical protein EV292_105249 [Sphingomonas sp. BK235]